MSPTSSDDSTGRVNGHWWFRGPMLLLWALASFGSCYYARDLSDWHWDAWGGSLGYWMAAQGAVLVFLLIVVLNAWVMNRLEGPEDGAVPDGG